MTWQSRLCLQNLWIDLQSLDLIWLKFRCESVFRWMLIVVTALRSAFKTSAELRLENIALRHQLAVLRRSAPKRLKITASDRLLWVWLRRFWPDWKTALVIVKPQTVVSVAAPPQDYCERYRQLTGQDLLQCPQCRKGQMRRIGVLPAGAAPAGWDSS